MTRLPYYYHNRCISSGTMRHNDLIGSFEVMLDKWGVEYERPEIVNTLMLGYRSELTSQEREQVCSYLEALSKRLNEIAPKGTTFCSFPGGGMLFGFWSDIDIDIALNNYDDTGNPL